MADKNILEKLARDEFISRADGTADGGFVSGSDPKVVALARCWAHALPVMQDVLDQIDAMLELGGNAEDYREAMTSISSKIFNEFGDKLLNSSA